MKINLFAAFFFVVLFLGCGSSLAFSQDPDGLSPQSEDKSEISIASGGNWNINSSEQVKVASTNAVTVDQNGSMRVSSSKSIVLLPGTKIKSGGFMYASITSTTKKGKPAKKITKLVTVEENEKLMLHESLIATATPLTPFVQNPKGHLRKSGTSEESVDQASIPGLMVMQDYQRKVAGTLCSRTLSDVFNGAHLPSATQLCKEFVPPCRFVLRL